MDQKEKATTAQASKLWNISRLRVVCCSTGIASMVLVFATFVFEVQQKGHAVRLVSIAAAFLLQAVCGALLWQYGAPDRTHPISTPYRHTIDDAREYVSNNTPSCPPRVTEQSSSRITMGNSTRERSSRRRISGDAADKDIRSSSLTVAGMEQGASAGNGLRSPRGTDPSRFSANSTELRSRSSTNLRSSRRVAVGDRDEDEAAFARHCVLETPLQQAARTLEFVLDKYQPDARTTEKLEMVLNIISLPEDLNTVTIQSIMNADLDSSTTEWMEAQLSPGATVVSDEKRGEIKWGRLRDGLRGVVHRMATELVEDKRDLNGTGTGMNTDQLRRQQEVGRAYKMEKAASGRSRRQSTNINVRQLMTLPCARGRTGGTLAEVDEHSITIQEEGTDDQIYAEQRALTEILPTWPGIEVHAQKAVVDLVTTRHFLDWGFDVFRLHELSGGHALWYTGMLTLYHYNYVGVFNVSPLRLSNFLKHVEYNYCFDPTKPNPYHTSVHAADVTLTVGHFCENEVIASGIKALQGFALLVAAIVHDFRHRGVNNGFLIKVRDKLAITYNDSSVLESFHLSEAFQVLYDDKFNILEGLSTDEHRHFRQFLIKIVLATDLAHGFEYVARFTASTNTKSGRRASIVPDMARDGAAAGGSNRGGAGAGGVSGGAGSAGKDVPAKDPLQAQILLMQMVIKVADVSHPMKPWELHEKWTNLITEEFHRQGDFEAEMGVPVSPLCSREGHNPAKSQCDFINFVVRPCATVFSSFSRDTLWVSTLERNYQRWSDMAT